MAKIVELQRADDPRDPVYQAVEAIAQGDVVGLPTETGYVAAVNAILPDAVDRLAAYARSNAFSPGHLSLKSANEALDYLPPQKPPGERLIRRCWPGPVALVFEQSNGLATQLPAGTVALASDWGGLTLRVPHQPALLSVSRLVPGPLLVSGDVFAEQIARTATELPGEGISLILDDGPTRFDKPSAVVAIRGPKWEMLREGVVSVSTMQRISGPMVLFVCTGNTCRSPMAEALFRRMLVEHMNCTEEELYDRGCIVTSAGLSASPGFPASPEGVEILAAKGIDLHGHSSQPASPRLLSQADFVFTMTRGHREMILREFPELGPRVTLLCRDGTDIVDPIGAGMEEYEQCAAQIEQQLRLILTEIAGTLES